MIGHHQVEAVLLKLFHCVLHARCDEDLVPLFFENHLARGESCGVAINKKNTCVQRL